MVRFEFDNSLGIFYALTISGSSDFEIFLAGEVSDAYTVDIY